MNKEELKEIVKKYFYGDEYEWFGFENAALVRYDLDSSKICYSLIRHYKPTSCFEVGTSSGHATIFILDALLRNYKETKQPFKFVAFEKEEGLYYETLKNLTRRHAGILSNIFLGDFTKNLGKIPKELDFAFIDTDHDKETTSWYVKNLFPRLKKDALVAIHDFAVEEKDDKWIGKGTNGTGGLEETQVLMDLYKQGNLPLEPIYWNYHNPLFEEDSPNWEASFWTKT